MWYITLLYCLPLLIPFIILTILVESDSIGWATTVSLITIAIVGYINKNDAVQFFKEHALHVAVGLLCYLAVGVVWSFIKWTLHLIKFRSRFRDESHAWKLAEKLPVDQPIPPERAMDFITSLGYSDFRSSLSLKDNVFQRPLARNFKKKIVSWMSFWPCSVVGYVLNDPVRRAFTAIFEAFRNSYQKVSNSIVNDAEFK